MYNGFNTYLSLLEMQHLMNIITTFIVFSVGIPQPSLQPIHIAIFFSWRAFYIRTPNYRPGLPLVHVRKARNGSRRKGINYKMKVSFNWWKTNKQPTTKTHCTRNLVLHQRDQLRNHFEYQRVSNAQVSLYIVLCPTSWVALSTLCFQKPTQIFRITVSFSPNSSY